MSKTSRMHREEAPKRLSFAVVTISTSRFRESKSGKHVEDESGDLIVETLKNHNHTVPEKHLISDDKTMIAHTIQKMLKSSKIDAIITCGGTGINPSDITIETVEPILEKTLPGFGEIFRQMSYIDIGSAAVMTRAIAGVAKGKAVFCLPGSPHAARLCLEKLILSESGHIILHARGR